MYAEPSDSVPYVWDYTLRDDGGLDFTYSVPPAPRSGDLAGLARDNATLTLIRTTAGGEIPHELMSKEQDVVRRTGESATEQR